MNPYYAGNGLLGGAIDGFIEGFRTSSADDMARKKLAAELEQQRVQQLLQQQQMQQSRDAMGIQQAQEGRAAQTFQNEQALQNNVRGYLNPEPNPDMPPEYIMGTNTPNPIYGDAQAKLQPPPDMAGLTKVIGQTHPLKAAEMLTKNEMSEEKLNFLRDSITLKNQYEQERAAAKSAAELAKAEAKFAAQKELQDEKYALLKGIKMTPPATVVMASNPPPKLKPGERYDPKTETVTAIPGSDLYINQSNKHGKDLTALNGIAMGNKNAISKIDSILDPKNTPYFNNNFGGYNAYISSRIPGKTQDIRNDIESLKSDLKVAGLAAIRTGGSVGAMTEKEWPIVESMLAKIVPGMGEEKARAELLKIKAYMEKLEANANDVYGTEWGNTQFYKPRNAQPNAGNAGSPDAKTAVKLMQKYGNKQAAQEAWARGER